MVVVTTSISERRRPSLAPPSPVKKSVSLLLAGLVCCVVPSRSRRSRRLASFYSRFYMFCRYSSHDKMHYEPMPMNMSDILRLRQEDMFTRCCWCLNVAHRRQRPACPEQAVVIAHILVVAVKRGHPSSPSSPLPTVPLSSSPPGDAHAHVKNRETASKTSSTPQISPASPLANRLPVFYPSIHPDIGPK